MFLLARISSSQFFSLNYIFTLNVENWIKMPKMLFILVKFYAQRWGKGRRNVGIQLILSLWTKVVALKPIKIPAFKHIDNAHREERASQTKKNTEFIICATINVAFARLRQQSMTDCFIWVFRFGFFFPVCSRMSIECHVPCRAVFWIAFAWWNSIFFDFTFILC